MAKMRAAAVIGSICLIFFHFFNPSTAIRVFEQTHLAAEETNQALAQQQLKFIDALIQGILGMLMGSLGGNKGQGGGAPPPVATAPPAEAPSVTEEEPALPTVGPAPVESTPAPPKQADLEGILVAAVTQHSNSMDTLKKQMKDLEKEIKKWKEMGDKQAEAADADKASNAIHLSIEYPGMAAKKNATKAEEPPPEEEEEEEEEKPEEKKKINPEKLHVPILVVAPKPVIDYRRILEKTKKEQQKQDTGAAKAQQTMEAEDPEETLERHQMELRDAKAKEIFFETDEKQTQKLRKVEEKK